MSENIYSIYYTLEITESADEDDSELESDIDDFEAEETAATAARKLNVGKANESRFAFI